MKLNTTYRFSLLSSLYISVIVLIISFVLYGFEAIPVFVIPIITLTVFIVSFYIIHHRVRKYIFKRIKKMYEEVKTAGDFPISPKAITTDLDSLSKEVERFAQNKEMDIAELKIREPRCRSRRRR